MKEKNNKSQWNTRIPPEYLRNVKIIIGHTDYGHEDIAQLALAVLFGVDAGDQNSPVNQCWKKCQEVFKKHGVKCLPTTTLLP